MVGKASVVPRKSELESQLYHSVAEQPWVGCLIPVTSSFLIYKLRILIPASWGCGGDKLQVSPYTQQVPTKYELPALQSGSKRFGVVVATVHVELAS